MRTLIGTRLLLLAGVLLGLVVAPTPARAEGLPAGQTELQVLETPIGQPHPTAPGVYWYGSELGWGSYKVERVIETTITPLYSTLSSLFRIQEAELLVGEPVIPSVSPVIPNIIGNAVRGCVNHTDPTAGPNAPCNHMSRWRVGPNGGWSICARVRCDGSLPNETVGHTSQNGYVTFMAHRETWSRYVAATKFVPYLGGGLESVGVETRATVACVNNSGSYTLTVTVREAGAYDILMSVGGRTRSGSGVRTMNSGQSLSFSGDVAVGETVAIEVRYQTEAGVFTSEDDAVYGGCADTCPVGTPRAGQPRLSNGSCGDGGDDNNNGACPPGTLLAGRPTPANGDCNPETPPPYCDIYPEDPACDSGGPDGEVNGVPVSYRVVLEVPEYFVAKGLYTTQSVNVRSVELLCGTRRCTGADEFIDIGRSSATGRLVLRSNSSSYTACSGINDNCAYRILREDSTRRISTADTIASVYFTPTKGQQRMLLRYENLYAQVAVMVRVPILERDIYPCPTAADPDKTCGRWVDSGRTELQFAGYREVPVEVLLTDGSRVTSSGTTRHVIGTVGE